MQLYQWLTIFGVQAFFTGIVGIIIGLINGAIQKKTAAKLSCSEDAAVMKEAMQAILRNKLYEIYQKAIEKGHATIQEKEIFNTMYEKYHKLGANGVMDQVYEDYMNLPN